MKGLLNLLAIGLVVGSGVRILLNEGQRHKEALKAAQAAQSMSKPVAVVQTLSVYERLQRESRLN